MVATFGIKITLADGSVKADISLAELQNSSVLLKAYRALPGALDAFYAQVGELVLVLAIAFLSGGLTTFYPYLEGVVYNSPADPRGPAIALQKTQHALAKHASGETHETPKLLMDREFLKNPPTDPRGPATAAKDPARPGETVPRDLQAPDGPGVPEEQSAIGQVGGGGLTRGPRFGGFWPGRRRGSRWQGAGGGVGGFGPGGGAGAAGRELEEE